MSSKGKSHIERLKEHLYSPKNKNSSPKERGTLYPDEHTVTNSWKKDPVATHKKRKSLLENSMFRKFFWGAIIFFALAMIFGLVMFFGGSNTVSADNIEINVLGNAFVSGGEELPLKLQISNRNNVALQDADLLLEYQKGAGAGEDIQRDRVTVGTVPSGGMVENLINLTLFGQQGTTRDVNITLEYRVKGSSAIFIKQKLYVVNISSTPVNLLVEGPDVTNTNQEISFDITTSLNTEKAIENMMVVVDYPPGFDFKSATPEPTFSDHIWSLGDLSPGAEKTITVKGVVVADSGEERAFNIYTGTADEKDEQRIGTQLNSEDYIVSVEKPFLDLQFSVNGGSGSVVAGAAGQNSEGKIEFINNLDNKITDVEITAKFSGNAFDVAHVTAPQGFYDSSKQTIVWNSQTKSSLGSVEPGDRDTLDFNFRPIAFSGSSLKNPKINIEISIHGRQPNLGNQFLNIENFLEKEVRFGTQLQLTGYALHNSGPIANTGPLPPKAGTPTTYTIALSVTNTTNKVTGAKARTVLPLYMDWTNQTSPQSQSVTYNPATHEIVWDIGTIDPGVSATKQVYFQVKLNPSGSQSGTTPSLILDTTLTAKDSYTSVEITREIQDISTRLNHDTGYNPENDAVE